MGKEMGKGMEMGKETNMKWSAVLETALEVSSAALLTWFLFLAMQALALQLMTEGF